LILGLKLVFLLLLFLEFSQTETEFCFAVFGGARLATDAAGSFIWVFLLVGWFCITL